MDSNPRPAECKCDPLRREVSSMVAIVNICKVCVVPYRFCRVPSDKYEG